MQNLMSDNALHGVLFKRPGLKASQCCSSECSVSTQYGGGRHGGRFGIVDDERRGGRAKLVGPHGKSNRGGELMGAASCNHMACQWLACIAPFSLLFVHCRLHISVGRLMLQNCQLFEIGSKVSKVRKLLLLTNTGQTKSAGREGGASVPWRTPFVCAWM